MVETSLAIQTLTRWAHIGSGIFWIGLLYYFNVVQVPVFKKLDAATRSNAIQKLVPVALAWFRYAALATVLFGLLLLYYQGQMTQAYLASDRGIVISAGMALGLIMAFNVWYFIWPNQKKIIQANVDKATQGKDIPPESAQWAKTAFYASRFNFLASFPMLFWMVATTHMAGATANEALMIGVVIWGVAGAALWYFTTMKPATTAATTPAPPQSK